MGKRQEWQQLCTITFVFTRASNFSSIYTLVRYNLNDATTNKDNMYNTFERTLLQFMFKIASYKDFVII